MCESYWFRWTKGKSRVPFTMTFLCIPLKLNVLFLKSFFLFKVRPKNSYSKIINIRPYSVWVENNSETDFEDSRTFSSVSKKLLIGQADRIIWPPSRWGKIRRERPAVGRAWWP